MRLSDREFRAMNNPVRRFFQRRVEFPDVAFRTVDATDLSALERELEHSGFALERRRRSPLFGFHRAVAC